MIKANKRGFVQLLELLILVIVIGCIVFGGIWVFKNMEFENGSLSIGGTTVNVNIDEATGTLINEDDQTITSEPNSETFYLGDWFTDNFPDYIDNRSTNCVLFGGTWISNQDAVGCYNIPVWDDSLCTSTELAKLKLLCLSVQGTFTCGEHQVGCET
jgi:hypothetical protein